MSEHSSRTVVITGASAGIGRATAIAFGREGDRVALLARGRAGLEAAAADVRAAGGEAMILPTDVADFDAVEAAANAVEAEWGPIDVWVNSAMTAKLATVENTTAEEFRRITEVTYLGSVHGCLVALERMKARDSGTIIQVGSALCYLGIPLQATYCAAKHAIQGFFESTRAELLHDRSNVHFGMVHLPGVNTPQFGWVRTTLGRHPQPVPPIYQPEVAAKAIVWAAGRRRREVWVGFPTVQTILGSRFAPWLAERYLASQGFSGQESERPIDPDREDNLYSPADEETDAGAHGIFDSRAKSRSAQLWASMHRRALGLAGTALTAGAAAAALRR